MNNTLMIKKAIFLCFFLTAFGQASAQKVYWATEVVDFSSELSPFEYSAKQALGKPNSLPQAGDSPVAWLPSKPNKLEYIKVAFEKNIKVRQIAIAESYNPSATYKVYLYDEAGNEYHVHTFEPRPVDLTGRLLTIFIEKTDYDVYALKLELDGDAVPGYSGIDAIGISSSRRPIEIEVDVPENVRKGIQIDKLSENVNSRYIETRPLIAPDGKTLYFSRSFHPENMGGEDDENDIWYSEYDPETGEWNKATNIGSPLNNKGANYISSITPDGKSMTVILGNEYTRRDKMKPGVSITTKTSEGWDKPKTLDIINAYIEDTDGNYFLANNRRVLIMAVNRYDSYGGKDLYVSFLQADGRWTEPLNLGNDINTAHNESSPYLAADNETLYFSSKGYSGFGGSDIYISRRLDDTWTNWTEPENLGTDINSKEDDVFFTIPPSGKLAYFSRSNTAADADIHQIQLPIFFQPAPVISIKGKVVDKETDEPIRARLMYKLQPENKIIGFTESDSITGNYEVLLPVGAAYTYTVTAQGYTLEEQSIDLMEESDYRELNRDLLMARVDGAETDEPEEELPVVVKKEDDQDEKVEKFLNDKTEQLVLDDFIFFDFASDYLKEEAKPILNKIAEFLKENSKEKIQIEGHTDNVGPSSYNLSLSKRRAESVKNYLASQGVKKSQLETKGFGSDQPVATNDTKEGRAKNRRVEFKRID